jgi:hypothetical protein
MAFSGTAGQPATLTPSELAAAKSQVPAGYTFSRAWYLDSVGQQVAVEFEGPYIGTGKTVHVYRHTGEVVARGGFVSEPEARELAYQKQLYEQPGKYEPSQQVPSPTPAQAKQIGGQYKREQEISAGIIRPKFKERTASVTILGSVRPPTYPMTEETRAEQLSTTLTPLPRKTFLQKQAQKYISESPNYQMEESSKWLQEARSQINIPLKGFAYTLYGGSVIGETLYDFETGYRRGLREQPGKTLAITGISFIAPTVIGKLGARIGIAKIAMKYPGTAEFLSEVVKTGTIGIYVALSSLKVQAEPNYKMKVQRVGQIFSTEVSPMIVGGYAGLKTIPKIETYFKTYGAKEIPIKDIVAPEVLLGKKKFATAPMKATRIRTAQSQLEMFQQDLYKPKEWAGYYPHATPSGFGGKEVSILPGTSEISGTYVSGKGASVYFLKIGQEKYTLYGGNLFGPSGVPEIMYFKPTQLTTGGPRLAGQAFIPGMKSEVEAVITPGSTFKATPDKFFTVYKGQRVPISLYDYTGAKQIATAKQVATITSMIKSSSSYGARSIGVTGPSSYIAALSYKKSLVSSIPSLPSRITTISKPSKPSIIPISTTPSKSITRLYSITPSMPSYPSPSIPSMPSYPSPSIPSMPSYPSPSIPSMPSYPSPSIPSMPSYPSVPSVTSKILKPSKQIMPKILMPSFASKYKPQKFKALKLAPALRPFKYAPSLYAFSQKITGKRPRRLTGYEIRPLI